ncbi:DUF2612 domain-containing protein [Pelistega sp. MC2]|uniref:DUF2612 domain-containing protein n=1 Tax=Pelistega sp. MC2 TaxID=1720297 RepID=UPI0008DA7502|nr:DUF2612 domain-containing protein [Pelistega sp. MC2]
MAYAELLIWQYRGKPKAKATATLLDGYLSASFQDAIDVMNVLNIETAQGVNLDMVGRHVGQSRTLKNYAPIGFFGFKDGFGAMPFSKERKGGGQWYRYRDPLRQSVSLNDEDYRFLIRARISRNFQTATLPNLISALTFILGGDCIVTDNYDMTVTIQIPEVYKTRFKAFALEELDILPRGTGVKYNIIWGDVPITKYFGFRNAANALGFSQGGEGGAKFFIMNKGN